MAGRPEEVRVAPGSNGDVVRTANTLRAADDEERDRLVDNIIKNSALAE
jgi:hypothetical protein